jgi:hypothetical protein
VPALQTQNPEFKHQLKQKQKQKNQPLVKKNFRAGRVAQLVEYLPSKRTQSPEFKPQCHQKQKNQEK